MYYRYFGLQEAPFSIAPNPHYLFMSARHRDALAHLLYGVGAGGGFILLTGEVGTGKTTVTRCLLEQIPENTDIALVMNPMLNAVELLATVCDELGISANKDANKNKENVGEPQSLKQLTDKLHQFLVANHANNRNTVLLIDEAQHLDFDVLEQIRLLTNLETNTRKLLQIILVGQPELKTKLAQPRLRQLAQRITARYELQPLTRNETGAYIRYRLQVAGLPANQTLFPNSVIKGIHHASGGIPRLINVICDRALLGSYGQNRTSVDRSLLRQAVVEAMGESANRKQTPVVPLTVGAIVLCLSIALTWWQWPEQPKPSKLLAQTPKTDDTNARNNLAGNDEKEVIGAGTIKPQASAAEAVQQPTNTVESVALVFWYPDQQQAIRALVNELNPDSSITAAQDPCASGDDNNDSGLRCESVRAKTWADLRAFNRPAVLRLATEGKVEAYAVLLAIEGNQAFLLSQKRQQSMPLEQLGKLWTGDSIFLWRPPPAFQGKAIGPGYRGPMVTWLARRFAEIDQQTRLLADDTYNTPLQQRIRLFQRQHGLSADGIVGQQTLLKLNEALGLALTLARPEIQEQTHNQTKNIEPARLPTALPANQQELTP